MPTTTHPSAHPRVRHLTVVRPTPSAPEPQALLRLPQDLEQRARAVANRAGLDLESWIVEALRLLID